jgi:pyruvate carboxylase subunit B
MVILKGVMKGMFFNRKENKAEDKASYFAAGAGPLKFNSVELRDGQQSLLSTRMRLEDILPILEKMDAVGYQSMEVWGGATFDVCIRFLEEDPWDRLRAIRRVVKKTPLKMLLRGQNLLGYTPYPNDLVERFVAKAAENGIDIIEVFDSLQDLRNCENAIKAVIKSGKRAEGGLMYTLSPLHNIDVFVRIAKEYEDMGVKALHIEDMAGLLMPKAAHELIGALKAAIRIPVFLQCHCTAGLAQMCYWEAIRAGVDGVDTCVSTLSLGPGHPPTESLVAAVRGTPRDSGLDLGLLSEIGEYFRQIRAKYKQFETEMIGVDIGVLQHQIPGGMLTNLESQLKGMNAYEKLGEVLKEVAEVRRDFGYPPLGTPSSQIVGAQATMNVLSGERYKIITNQTKDYLRFMYGRPLGTIDPELTRKALGDEKPITGKPGDTLESRFEQYKSECGSLARSEEDILTYAMFPALGKEFLAKKYQTA